MKLHTHGVNEPNQDVLLGEPMVRFHEMLSERARRDPLFRFHYVTAREMANLSLAAERNLDLTIQEARFLRYIPLEYSRESASEGSSEHPHKVPMERPMYLPRTAETSTG